MDIKVIPFPHLPVYESVNYTFALGRRNERELWITCEANGHYWCLNPITPDDRLPIADSAKIRRAYKTATSARFEFGEEGGK